MQTIVIFGGTSTIAQATARIWANRKDSFILVDRDEAKLKIVAEDLQTRGATKVTTLTANLTATDQHHHLWQQIKSAGKPDTVLIAYGSLGNQSADEKDVAKLQVELAINFTSVASLLTIIAADFEQNQAGTIAVISSVAGDRGRKSNYIYGSAKGALTIFLGGLRNRLAPQGVSVITIKPGFVDTPMTAHLKKGLLWAQPQTIAKGIVKAIDHKTPIVYLPWFWRYIMLIIRAIPERIFQNTSI